MFILNRAIPFIGPFLIWLIWEVFFTKPKSILIFGLIILAMVFLSFWQLLQRKFSKEFWQFFGLPFLFIFSAFLFSILSLPAGLSRHIFALAIAFLFYLILESVFNFLYRPNLYQTHSIETFFSHLSLLILFFIASSFYNLIFFLNFPFWLFLIFFLLVILFLTFYFFWVNKILTKENILYILVITLILTEFFWAISFLPTNFYVNSLILTLIYYLMIVLSKHCILKILNKKVIRQYLIITGLALLLILLTAQWR